MLKNVFKITLQIAIIYIIYTTGNFISKAISNFIIIPGNIMGMAILLILLLTNVLKLSHIEQTANFILKYMGFFFVPITASIINSYDDFKNSAVQIMLIFIVSNILVMYISAKTTDMLIARKDRSKQ